MNTFPTSLKKMAKIPPSVFLNSIYYTLPSGMFMVACNFLFESVKHYFFDWTVVTLPTIGVFIIGSLYEMFVVHQENGLFEKRENNFTAQQVGYSISNNNLATT